MALCSALAVQSAPTHAALRRPRFPSRAWQGEAAERDACGAAAVTSFPVEVRIASSSAELRAAAHLRVASFYSYPLDRSEFAARSHRRMKTNEEWDVLEQKIAGTAHDWQGVAVTCLVAVTDERPGDPSAEALAQDLDASCRLPAGSGEGALPQLVVGTLDVNQGARLPSEELAGREPAAGAATRRGYLSNVCVAAAVRRRGIATALILEAQHAAAASGVERLYVHVRARNAAALALYSQRCSFAVEARESEAIGQALGRPPRVLLRRRL